ncbi:MAG: tetratricopeptide repeat protein [Blastocatellia bacterium]|nr:tetratricopeptide repeat protein [Blastocatellia bacterium]
MTLRFPPMLAMFMLGGTMMFQLTPALTRVARQAPPKPPAAATTSTGIQAGVHQERQLRGDEHHSYRLTLKANNYVKLIVEQKGIDVVVRLVGPEGKILQEVDSANGTQGPETLSYIVEQDGNYTIDVASVEKTARVGKYELKQETLRVATDQDRATLEFETLLAQAEKLRGAGKYDQALPLAQQALEQCERKFGSEHLFVARSLTTLATVYFLKGDSAKAEPLFLRSLGMYEKTFGPNHPETATTLNNLAVFYKNKGDYAKAEPLNQRALAIREKTLSQDHPAVAESLDSLAMLYKSKGDYTKAEPLFQRALDIREKTLGPNHREVASTLNNLAAFYQDKGDLLRAELMFQRALAISEKTLGPDHPEVATRLNNLAALYRDKGNYAQAEPLCLRSLAIWEKTLGPDHPDVASSLNNLAGLYYLKGDYARGEQLYQRSLSIREKVLGPDHLDVAKTLNNLAVLYKTKGEYTKAEPMYQRALTIREKSLGPFHPAVATTLHNLANFYRDKGDYWQAEPLYLRSLAIAEKSLGPDHPELAITLNQLAALYQEKGDFVKAELFYQRSLAIKEKALGPDHSSVAGSLNNLATLYYFKGDFAKAEPMYQRALTIREKALGPNHTDVAASLNNLAALYRDNGDYAKAELFYQRSLAIKEKALGSEHPEFAKSLYNLGGLYQNKGDATQAEALFKRSLAIWEKAFGSDHPDVARSLNNLARVYQDKGDAAQAEALFKRSLAIREKILGPAHPEVAQSLNNLAGFYQAKGETGQAISYLIRGNETTERDLMHNLASGSEHQKALYLKKTASLTDQSISLHVQQAPQDRTALQAALTVILRRKGRTLDAMTNAISILRSQSDPETQKLLEGYRSIVGQISVQTLSGPGKNKPEAHLATLASLEAQKDKLENDISRRSGEFKVQATPITLEGVHKQIPADAVLVEYAVYRPFDPKSRQSGAPRFVVYVLKGPKPQVPNPKSEPETNPDVEIQFADLGEAEPIERAVATLRKVLSDKSKSVNRHVKPAAQALDRLVMNPVRALVGTTKHLLLSPDGALNLIPFAALANERGQYLVEQYNLTYLTSGRDLLRLEVKLNSQGEPLVMADPDYATGAGPQLLGQAFPPLRRLTGTQAEGEQLKKIFPNAQLKLKEEAGETVLKQVNRPELVHIATHGYFLKDTVEETSAEAGTRLLVRPEFQSVSSEQVRANNPLLRSWLFFAGANRGGTEENDGTMTALEAAQLNLWGTKLVTLSACDTGLGVVKNGDGVYGLRRALVLAGSEAQMMSLWPVSDQGTRELMVDYYTRLKTGEGRSEALRNTQLKLLKDPKRQHPYFWASFIQSGEWANLAGERK